MQQIKIQCSLENACRVDTFLSEQLEVTRSHAAMLIEKNCVLLQGKPVVKSLKVKNGDELFVTLPDPEPTEVLPENIPLDIVYEDDAFLVVNKPKNMVVHPAAGNPAHTLVNALLFHCKGSLSGINGVMRPGILHRIDKDTSGLLLVAKTDAAHNFLAKQIAEHTCNREYEAVVYGNIKSDSGTINAPIGRHPVRRQQMAVTSVGSKPAVTHYSVIARYNGFTHVRLNLETGRTHQIRVHMAYIGHPVAGDPVYGPKKVITSLCGQCLHAKKIGCVHPTTKQSMEFDSDLPEYFTHFLNTLKTNG